MSEYLTPQEVLDQVTASGYDGYWSMSADGKNGDKFVTVFFGAATEQQLVAALEMAPDGIEANKYETRDGKESASIFPWTICYPAKKAQS